DSRGDLHQGSAITGSGVAQPRVQTKQAGSLEGAKTSFGSDQVVLSEKRHEVAREAQEGAQGHIAESTTCQERDTHLSPLCLCHAGSSARLPRQAESLLCGSTRAGRRENSKWTYTVRLHGKQQMNSNRCIAESGLGGSGALRSALSPPGLQRRPTSSAPSA